MPSIGTQRDNATEMDQVSSTTQELKDRLVELTKQLDEAEKLKKAANKKMSDDIKDLKYEIQEVLMLMKDQEEEANEQ